MQVTEYCDVEVEVEKNRFTSVSTASRVVKKKVEVLQSVEIEVCTLGSTLIGLPP